MCRRWWLAVVVRLLQSRADSIIEIDCVIISYRMTSDHRPLIVLSRKQSQGRLAISTTAACVYVIYLSVCVRALNTLQIIRLIRTITDHSASRQIISHMKIKSNTNKCNNISSTGKLPVLPAERPGARLALPVCAAPLQMQCQPAPLIRAGRGTWARILLFRLPGHSYCLSSGPVLPNNSHAESA